MFTTIWDLKNINVFLKYDGFDELSAFAKKNINS